MKTIKPMSGGRAMASERGSGNMKSMKMKTNSRLEGNRAKSSKHDRKGAIGEYPR